MLYLLSVLCLVRFRRFHRFHFINSEKLTDANVEEQIKDMDGDKAMIKEEVDAEDIADVVSRWTGIPVSKMMLLKIPLEEQG